MPSHTSAPGVPGVDPVADLDPTRSDSRTQATAADHFARGDLPQQVPELGAVLEGGLSLPEGFSLVRL